MFENPERGTEARNFTTNVPKILDLKSNVPKILDLKSSLEQIFSENWRWVPLVILLVEHQSRLHKSLSVMS